MEKTIPIARRHASEFEVRGFFEMGLEESQSPFLTPFARRISENLPLKASIFSAILLLVSFLLTQKVESEAIGYIMLALVYLIVGVPALIHSVEDIIFHREVNIDVLMTLAAFSSIFIGSGFEGALLLVLFALSGAIEDAVSLKAKSALMELHKLVPQKAYVITDGEQTIERAIQDVAIGELVLVRSGEIVPLDGLVVSGASQVSLVHLTGESLPVRKEAGSEIPSGARVIEGALTIRITHLSQDSTVSRIVQLITQAQAAKPVLERWFDRFSRGYAMTIIATFFLLCLTFPLFVDIGYFGREGSIYRSLAFLITASPCALILAVPIAYLSSLGACARKGIVLKGGVVLDALEKCRVVAFDKTGTLTLGELVLDEVVGDIDSKEVISLAASLERNAVHPIAKAILKRNEELQGSFFPTNDVHVIAGYGVEGRIFAQNVALKSFIGDVEKACTLLPQNEAAFLRQAAKNLQREGKIVAALTIGDKGCLMSFSDHARPGMTRMLQSLRDSGRRLVMLTGDHYESAKVIAAQVGIDTFEADLKPEDKLRRIEELSSSQGLAMCGDGVNDAPALARSTVGICMGQVGSATARSAADVILLHDNIELLDWLFNKAAKTRKIVIQNLFIATLAIIAGTIPALCGVLPLWLAVIVHEGGTVLVGLNAIRLLKN